VLAASLPAPNQLPRPPGGGRQHAPRPLPPIPPTPGPATGSELVRQSIHAMIEGKCEEVVLEAEVTNQGALRLYQGLGFVRDKRLHRWGGGGGGLDAVLFRSASAAAAHGRNRARAGRPAEDATCSGGGS